MQKTNFSDFFIDVYKSISVKRLLKLYNTHNK